MDRVSTILDEYNSEYSGIWEGDLGTEDLDEMDKLYPGYREMNPEDMDSEIEVLRRKVTGPEQSEEKEDIKREIEYVSQLRRMKTWKNLETEAYLNATHGTLKEEVKTLVVLRRIAKAEVRRNDYSGKIDRLKGIIEKLGFDPNKPEEELEVEEEERRQEEARKKEEEERRKAAELERKRLAEEAAERQRKAEFERKEAEIKRHQESIKDDKEKTEYWRKKLEEWEKEKSIPKEEPKEIPKKPQPEEEPKKPKTGKPYRGKEPKKPDRGKKPEEPLPGVETEWLEDTFNFENLLFQVVEDTIPEDDQPIFSGDSTEIMLKDVREDLTRYERFKSWVEENFGFVLAGIIVSVAALLTAIIIQARKLSSMAANSTHRGVDPSPKPSPSPFPLPDIVSKLIKFISSNLWVVAVSIGIILLYMNS
ncbi:Hypothetical predicted protein [Paramuricea clavata]|uniref:Uncharacterized protein n=1 Tax=Paramuricea clavata TaxID=317549 RepID=A0A7D9E0M8_PARCT|nr:Hypothetical predicted protein [Paramuricea clavata]